MPENSSPGSAPTIAAPGDLAGELPDGLKCSYCDRTIGPADPITCEACDDATIDKGEAAQDAAAALADAILDCERGIRTWTEVVELAREAAP